MLLARVETELVEALASPSAENAKDVQVARRQMPLEEIDEADPKLSQLLEYWEDKRRDDLLPRRGDIDVIDLRQMIGDLHMVDVTDENPDEWTFRVVGSVIPESWDWMHGNPRLSDCPWPSLAKVTMEDYGAVRFTGVPTYHELAVRANFMVYRYSRIVLPLAGSNGRTVERLLVGVNRR